MEKLTSILDKQMEYTRLYESEEGRKETLEALRKLDALYSEIESDIVKISDKYHVDSIYTNIIGNILVDYQEEYKHMDWHLYTYDEYIEVYEVFETDKERSLYSFDLNNGKDWLQANELNEVEHMVYTRDFIAMAHDEI